MDDLTKRAARRAELVIGRVHNRLRRFLDKEARNARRSLQLTIGKAYDRGWEDFDCVFVLSTGRTGTQTLAAVLRLSPDIVAEHEPAPRLVKSSFDAYLEMGHPNWMDKWKPFVLATRDDFVMRARAEGKVYVESNNRLTYLAPALREAFPASKFIYVHREPYSVIRSGMKRGAYQGPDMAWNFARILPRPGEALADSWESLSPLEKEAWRWARINEEAVTFFESLPEQRRMELPSQVLFSNRNEVFEEVFSFLGVAAPDETDIRRIMGRRMNAQAHFNGVDFEWTDEGYDKVRPFIEPVASTLGYAVK